MFQKILHIFFFFFSSVKIPAPPCGKEPCCAGNRKGPGCSQPDLWPFRGRISTITLYTVICQNKFKKNDPAPKISFDLTSTTNV